MLHHETGAFVAAAAEGLPFAHFITDASPMRYCLALALAALPSILTAQQTPASRPAWDFSTLLFGNFQVRTDSAAKVPTGGKPASRFDVGRAYLTFRAPAGERASVRVTTDIFQNTAAGGWVVRLKYGILQYDLSRNFAGMDGLAAVARVGMLHTVVIEHVETFWPRWIFNSPVETHGFFSSADVGAATLFTLPRRRGEVYLTLTNGPGYTSSEVDRFKDVAARVSLTPFAGDSGLLRNFTISPWYYLGNTASQFVAGGPGQAGPVSEGVQRDRRGVFAGIRDRRLTVGLELAQRIEGVESGSNTTAAPRLVQSRTGTLRSGFAIVRPAELVSPERRSPLSVIGRFDSFRPDANQPAANRFMVLGAVWDLNARTSIALDHQRMSPVNNPAGIPLRTWFVHWTASF
jgi:hypothetical protein